MKLLFSNITLYAGIKRQNQELLIEYLYNVVKSYLFFKPLEY